MTAREQAAARAGQGRAAASEGYRWLVLIVAGTSAFMSALDGSIINIIIPQIQGQYQATMGDISWVSAAYLVTISSLLLSVGRLGDMWGYKWVFGSGFLVFGLGSLVCGLAPTLPALIGGRVIQGMGAAILMALSPALITTTFPGSERGAALGLQATLTYTGLTLGPSLGGFISGQWGWQWVFLINLPVAAIGAALAFAKLRPTERPARPGLRLRRRPAVRIRAGLPAAGPQPGRDLGLGRRPHPAVAGRRRAAAPAFLWQERRARQPMLPLWMFREPAFTGGVAAAWLQYAGSSCSRSCCPSTCSSTAASARAAAGAVMTAQPAAMVALAALPAGSPTASAPASPPRWAWPPSPRGSGRSRAWARRRPQDRWQPSWPSSASGRPLHRAQQQLHHGGGARDRQGVAAALLAAARNVGMVTGVTIASTLFADLRLQTDFLAAFRGTLSVGVALAALQRPAVAGAAHAPRP